jgi:DNA primase
MQGDGDIKDVKDRLDIAEVVSGYLQLKKSGTALKAVCPFHSEKTPSFYVNQERQMFHCFGCGESGDIFTFVQRMEGIEFVEALKLLAERAGVKLARVDTGKRDARRRVTDANKMAARYWMEVLRRSPGADRARTYVEKRGLSSGTMEDFMIGYAPDSWEATSAFLRKKEFTDAEMIAAGLAAKREKGGAGVYDKFRGRLMFPIRDVNGDVVGFTGRVLPGIDGKDPEGPKYVNTVGTEAYNKGRILYGLDLAKQEIRAQNLAIVVEGNMDVIASHQAGVTNVVASSGTALTEEQLALLKRFTDRLVLSFDQDAAGENAARRGLDLAVAAGFAIRILRLPKDAGKDPDDCIRKDVGIWKQAIADAVPHLQWYLDLATARTDFADADAKRRAARELIVEIAKLPEAVERSHWIREVGNTFTTPEPLILEEVEAARRKGAGQAPARPGKTTAAAEPSQAPKPPKDRGVLLVEHALAMGFRWPEMRSTLVNELAPQEVAPEMADLYRDFILFYNDSRQDGGSREVDFRGMLEGRGITEAAKQVEVLELLGEKEFGGLDSHDLRPALLTLIGEIKKLHVTRRRQELLRAMAEAERVGDTSRIEDVQRQLHDLIR